MVIFVSRRASMGVRKPRRAANTDRKIRHFVDFQLEMQSWKCSEKYPHQCAAVIEIVRENHHDSRRTEGECPTKNQGLQKREGVRAAGVDLHVTQTCSASRFVPAVSSTVCAVVRSPGSQ